MSARKAPFALSSTEQQRVDAVDRLAASGDAGLDELVAMLTDGSWTVRRAVVGSLAAAGQGAVAALCEVLRAQRDDETRIAAAMDALVGSIGQPRPQLLALLASGEAATVADAASVLGRRRDAEAVPALVRLLGHVDDNVAVAAIEALGRIGGRSAVEALVPVLASGRFFRVFPAMDVLGRSGDPRAVGPLAQLLRDPQYGTDAARALAHTADRSAVMPLAALLNVAGDARVRVGAVALAELRERYRERFGRTDAVDDALRRAASIPGAPARLIAAASGAAPSEQIAIAALLGVLGGDEAAAALSRFLEGPERVATAAAAALDLLGAAADIPVRQALRDGDSARRRSLLALVDRPSALEEVLLCLADPDPGVRALACDALGRTGNPSAVRSLFQMLADPSPSVAQAAVAAIQVLGSPETEALARAAARADSPRVRRAALGILAYFGNPGALDHFLAALDDPESQVREAAIVGLPYIDAPRALDAVLAAARSPTPRTRAVAMRALALCASEQRTTAALVRGLADGDAWVRYYACQALGRIRHEAAGEPIATLLADPAGQVRVAAIEALSHLRSPIARTALEAAARSADADLQRAALVGIGIARYPGAVDILTAAARSEDPATRLMAISALSGVESPEALATLAAAAGDPDAGVRTAALSVLAACTGPAVVDVLVERLRAQPDDLAAARALATPAAGRVEDLSRALDAADEDIAMALASALARLRAPEATAALLRALTATNRAARKAAATAVIALGTEEARSAVERASRDDPDPDVRTICALLLGG